MVRDPRNLVTSLAHHYELSLDEAAPIVNKVTNSNPDLILFIGNAAEAKTLAQAVLTTKKQFELPIFSHWGVTGGDFFEFISKAQDHSLDLTFIQTKFAFTNPELSPLAQQVLHNAINTIKILTVDKISKHLQGLYMRMT